MAACQIALGLPRTIGGEKIEGRVDKIGRANVVPEGMSVVCLTDASGMERDQASELFRVIRHSGYQPSRKTLRKEEIIIVLTDEQAKEIKIGARIQITDYMAVILEDSKILHTAKVGRITTIAK